MSYNMIFDGVAPQNFVYDLDDDYNVNPALTGETLVSCPDFDTTYNHDEYFDLVFCQVELVNPGASTPSGEWWKKDAKRNHGIFRLNGHTAEEQAEAFRRAIDALPDAAPEYDKFGFRKFGPELSKGILRAFLRITEWWLAHPEIREKYPEMTGTWRRRFG